MKKSFEIESDCLDIIKRIKEIDKDYFVVRNLDRGLFELHCFGQGQSTFCLTLPDVLDERAVDLVLKTRVQNFDELIAEAERQNEQLEKRQAKEVLDDFKEQLYDS